MNLFVIPSFALAFSISTGLSELTMDLPSITGFIAQWLEHMPRILEVTGYSY